MQLHHQINRTDVNKWTILTTVTLASSNSTPADDGDYTETFYYVNPNKMQRYRVYFI
jgi:hypothetical protein